MVASACASLEWLDAAVTSVPLAIMALARQVVKVFVYLLVSPLLFPFQRQDSLFPFFASSFIDSTLDPILLGWGSLDFSIIPHLSHPDCLYLIPSLPV